MWGLSVSARPKWRFQQVSKIMLTTLILAASVLPMAVTSAGGEIMKAGMMPSHFSANRGQADPSILFVERTVSGSRLFTANSETLLMSRKTDKVAASRRLLPDSEMQDPLSNNDSRPAARREYLVFQSEYLNANPDVTISGEDELSWKSNYFLGNEKSAWTANVPNYNRLRFAVGTGGAAGKIPGRLR